MSSCQKYLPYQTIETERLILRQWRKDDLEPFAKLNADKRVREFFPSTLSYKESYSLVENFSQLIEKNGWGFWAASCKKNDVFVGMVGLAEVTFSAPFTPAIEIAWGLAYEQWGKGYATEGACAAIDFAFSKLELDEVVAFAKIGNQRSRQVMKRIGMTYDPNDDFDHPKLPLNHPLRRHVLYRLRREQWKDRIFS